MASIVKLLRHGAVGFIDWLDGRRSEENESKVKGGAVGKRNAVSLLPCYFGVLEGSAVDERKNNELTTCSVSATIPSAHLDTRLAPQ